MKGRYLLDYLDENNFKKSFDNKYINVYEYIRREHKVNDFFSIKFVFLQGNVVTRVFKN